VINQENSGGPVLDSFGRMVGMATATYSTYTTSVSSRSCRLYCASGRLE
jgi:S1-C subfamily serine protease